MGSVKKFPLRDQNINLKLPWFLRGRKKIHLIKLLPIQLMTHSLIPGKQITRRCSAKRRWRQRLGATEGSNAPFLQGDNNIFPSSLSLSRWMSCLLTFALLSGRLALGVAVEAGPAALAALALGVAQALEASAAHVVAHAQGVEVHVAVALAPRARTDLPGLSQRVAVVAVFARLTAGPCCGGGEW